MTSLTNMELLKAAIQATFMRFIRIIHASVFIILLLHSTIIQRLYNLVSITQMFRVVNSYFQES
jgi:hypothetical protein